MARIQLSGTQIPTLSKLNIDGEISLDAQSGTSGQILTSAGSGNTPTWNSTISLSGDISTSGKLYVNASSGDEGGEIFLNKPATNTSIDGGVNIDIYQNKLRFWESGGTARGYYIDLTAGGAGVSTSLTGGTTGAMNWEQQASGKVSGVSASGVTIVSRSFTTNGYPVQVMVTGDAENSTAGAWVKLQLYRDSTAIGKIIHVEMSAASENVPYALTFIDQPTAGTYTYALKTVSTVATGTMNFGETDGPVLTLIELSGPKGDTGSSATDFTGSGTLITGISSTAGNTLPISTLASTTGNTPAISLATGSTSFTTGITGGISITTGTPTASVSSSSGNITISTGNASGSSSGAGGTISITAGNGAGSAGQGGSVNINAGAAVTTGTVQIGNSTGFVSIGRSALTTSINGGLSFAAGTATLAPIKLTSGTNLTTISAGSFEYDGNVFYGTPKVNNSTAGRGVIPTTMYFSPANAVTAVSSNAGGTVTGNAFGKSIYLAASTVYQIEAYIILQTTYTTTATSALSISYTAPAGTTSAIFSTGSAATAAATTSTTTNSTFNLNSSASSLQATFASSGLYNRVYIKGTIKTSTTAGNFNININAVNSPPSTTTIYTQPASFISMTPISAGAGSDINVGGWA